MSDVQATTQSTGAAGPVDTEAHFENLWESGAFSASGTKPEDEGAAGANSSAQGTDGAQGLDDGTQGTQTAQEGTEEAPAYASLDEFLTAHKADPEAFKALLATVKIDGQEKQVPLSDVLKSYQLEGHVNNKSIELSNQKTAFEQEQLAARQMASQQIQQNAALGNLAMQMLNQDYQRVDWNALRVQNPAEFAALQSDFQQRQQGIQGYLQQVGQQQQQEAQQQQQNMQQALVTEREKLLGARPEWRDEGAFTKERENIAKYARNIGFQDAELNQIFDHRYMLILHDAARYQALQAAKPEALRQVREAPRMAKPGSRTDANPSDARRSEAIQRFNRNPRDIDAQAAVFDFLAG
jgi:hypothetical protein